MQQGHQSVAGDDEGGLVRRMWAGDTDAFDLLYEHYASRLLAYIQGMVRDEAMSQDLLQDVFLRLVEGQGRYDPERPLSRWLYAVAHNLSCSQLRRRQVRRQSEASAVVETRHQADAVQPAPPGDALDSERFTQHLAEALGHLDPELAAPFSCATARACPLPISVTFSVARRVR